MTLESLIAVMVLLMLCSAFFSSSETTLFSLSRSTLVRWRNTGSATEKMAAGLMDDQRSTLSAILLGNNFVNLLSALILVRIIDASRLLSDYVSWVASSLHLERHVAVELVSVLVSTVVLLTFGELTPKAIAYSMPNKLAPKIALPIFWLRSLTSPFIFLLKKASTIILTIVGGDKKSRAITADEYKTFTRMAHKVGVFEGDEIDLFERVFRLGEVRIAQIMTPRPDITYADVACDLKQLDETVRLSRHTMIPIVDGDLDNVVGVLDSRKFITLDYDERDDWRNACMTKAIYVPKNAHADVVLEQFRKEAISLAFVVNEFGGVEGLIKVEDMLEEVIGEIYDEFDQPDWSVVEIRTDEWLVSGLTPLDEIRRELDIDLGEVAAETIAGYVSEKLERIPGVGDEFYEDGWKFVVCRIKKRRILDVSIEKLKSENER